MMEPSSEFINVEVKEESGDRQTSSSHLSSTSQQPSEVDRIRDADRSSHLVMNPTEDPLEIEVKEEPLDNHAYAPLPPSTSQQTSGMSGVRAKRTYNGEKKDCKGSEGGPPQKQPKQPIPLEVTPFDNPFDSDAEPSHECAYRTRDITTPSRVITTASCNSNAHQRVIADMEAYGKRSTPIGVVGRDYLVELIMQEPVLHNKKTDGRMVLLKKKAWARVATKFNGAGYDTKKTEQQLMKVWERVKAKVKRDHAKDKGELRKTGDVPPSAISEETEKVLSIIGSEVNDLDSYYDSDAHSSDHRCSSISAASPSGTLSPPAREPFIEVMGIESLDSPKPHRANTTVDDHPAVAALQPSMKQQAVRRKHKFSASQSSTEETTIIKEQLAILAEQLQVAKLQHEAEKLRIELLKEQLKNARLETAQQESEKLRIELLKEQLRKARLENAALELQLKGSFGGKEVYV